MRTPSIRIPGRFYLSLYLLLLRLISLYKFAHEIIITVFKHGKTGHKLAKLLTVSWKLAPVTECKIFTVLYLFFLLLLLASLIINAKVKPYPLFITIIMILLSRFFLSLFTGSSFLLHLTLSY